MLSSGSLTKKMADSATAHRKLRQNATLSRKKMTPSFLLMSSKTPEKIVSALYSSFSVQLLPYFLFPILREVSYSIHLCIHIFLFLCIATCGLHPGFLVKLRIWQVSAWKMEPQSGYIFCQEPNMLWQVVVTTPTQNQLNSKVGFDHHPHHHHPPPPPPQTFWRVLDLVEG